MCLSVSSGKEKNIITLEPRAKVRLKDPHPTLHLEAFTGRRADELQPPVTLSIPSKLKTSLSYPVLW